MSAMTEHAPSRRSSLLLVLCSIPVLAILLALGTWQVQRLMWKEALIERIEERIVAAPQPLEEIAALHAAGQDVDYRPVSLAGTFRHEGERHYLATWRGQSGFYVHTPLELEDGLYIFVNRGFVPYSLKDPATRPEGQVTDTVEIGGLARMAEPEKPSFIVPDNDPAQNVFYWRDLDAMTRTAGLEQERVYPFFVDAGDAPNPGGLPVGGVTRINLPNNHLQYAVTWYGLALALVGVLGYWFVSRRKPDDT